MAQHFSADQQLLLASLGLQIVSQGGCGPKIHILDMQMHMGNLLPCIYTLTKTEAC